MSVVEDSNSSWLSRLGRRKRILIEILFIYVATIGLIKLLYELRFLPVIQSYLWTVAMLLQIYVPVWVLYRQEQAIMHFGLHLRRWQRGALWWLFCCVLFLPPAILGNHVWQAWQGFDLQTHNEPYLQLPVSLRGEPSQAKSDKIVQIYSVGTQPTVFIRWQSSLKGWLSSDKPLLVTRGASWVHGKTRKKKIYFSSGSVDSPVSIKVQVQGRYLRYRFERDGKSLSRRLVLLGPSQSPAKKREIFRGLGWLFHLILAQLLMVALPEEFFYRGLLQTKMDMISPPKYFYGIPLSWGNVLVSALFALTHFLIGHQPHRLSVFFPSLLFGALKQRTGSLLAPILFHASANIFMRCLEVWYS